MKIQVSVLTSESASAKAKKNAVAFFGAKGESILSKLEELKKEKLVDTKHIDTMVAFLSKATPEQVAKVKASATGKKIKPLFAKVASAKSISAVFAALRAAKTPAALAKIAYPEDAKQPTAVKKAAHRTERAATKARTARSKARKAAEDVIGEFAKQKARSKTLTPEETLKAWNKGMGIDDPFRARIFKREGTPRAVVPFGEVELVLMNIGKKWSVFVYGDGAAYPLMNKFNGNKAEFDTPASVLDYIKQNVPSVWNIAVNINKNNKQQDASVIKFPGKKRVAPKLTKAAIDYGAVASAVWPLAQKSSKFDKGSALIVSVKGNKQKINQLRFSMAYDPKTGSYTPAETSIGAGAREYGIGLKPKGNWWEVEYSTGGLFDYAKGDRLSDDQVIEITELLSKEIKKPVITPMLQEPSKYQMEHFQQTFGSAFEKALQFKPVFKSHKDYGDADSYFVTLTGAKKPRGWYNRLVDAVERVPGAKITLNAPEYKEMNFNFNGGEFTLNRVRSGEPLTAFLRYGN